MCFSRWGAFCASTLIKENYAVLFFSLIIVVVVFSSLNKKKVKSYRINYLHSSKMHHLEGLLFLFFCDTQKILIPQRSQILYPCLHHFLNFSITRPPVQLLCTRVTIHPCSNKLLRQENASLLLSNYTVYILSKMPHFS